MTAYVHSSTALTDARQTHKLAIIGWYDTVETELSALSDHLGVDGPQRAVVFTPRLVEDPTDDHYYRFELETVTFAGLTNETELTAPTDDYQHRAEEWVHAVTLWTDLCDLLSTYNADQIGPGIILDLDNRTIATWELLHCPDIGPYPVSLNVVDTLETVAADSQADPFTKLLTSSNEEDLDNAEADLQYLVDLHDLTLPTTPGHEPNECGTDTYDHDD